MNSSISTQTVSFFGLGGRKRSKQFYTWNNSYKVFKTARFFAHRVNSKDQTSQTQTCPIRALIWLLKASDTAVPPLVGAASNVGDIGANGITFWLMSYMSNGAADWHTSSAFKLSATLSTKRPRYWLPFIHFGAK